MPRYHRPGSILLVAAAWLSCVAAGGAAPLTAEDKRAIVDQLSQTIEANYVFPDKARNIAAALRAFQVRHGLPGDGQLDAPTLFALGATAPRTRPEAR